MRALTLAALSLALAATLASPAGAAKRAPKSSALKGQVVSAPYSGRGLTAVPVMLSKTSAKRAGLRSPVGVLILPEGRTVATPAGAVAPAQLRPGDQVLARIARGAIGREARQAPYWRLPLSDLQVTARTKTLSLDELQQLMAWIRRDLDTLAGWTVGETRDLRAQLEALRNELAALRNELAALRAAVTTLAGVDEQLRSQLEAVVTRVNELAALLGLPAVEDVTSDEGGDSTLPLPLP